MARHEIKKIALYAGVSTHEQQTLPLQLSAMRKIVEERFWMQYGFPLAA